MGNGNKHLIAKSSSISSEGIKDLKEILEIEKLSRLLEQFYNATGLANFIVDLKGNILQGLIGEKIPLLSRIVAIVDSFDAMTNDRAYRSAMTKEEAKEEIRRNSGTQFDPNISQLFLKIIS